MKALGPLGLQEAALAARHAGVTPDGTASPDGGCPDVPGSEQWGIDTEGLDAAVRRIRGFALQNGMTPGQLLDCFLAGVRASRVFGAGSLVPSSGWQLSMFWPVGELDSGEAGHGR